jgi:uncharacterized protein YbbK (DUF523 family)
MVMFCPSRFCDYLVPPQPCRLQKKRERRATFPALVADEQQRQGKAIRERTAEKMKQTKEIGLQGAAVSASPP